MWQSPVRQTSRDNRTKAVPFGLCVSVLKSRFEVLRSLNLFVLSLTGVGVCSCTASSVFDSIFEGVCRCLLMPTPVFCGVSHRAFIMFASSRASVKEWWILDLRPLCLCLLSVQSRPEWSSTSNFWELGGDQDHLLWRELWQPVSLTGHCTDVTPLHAGRGGCTEAAPCSSSALPPQVFSQHGGLTTTTAALQVWLQAFRKCAFS